MYNKLQSFEAIHARIAGDFTNPQLLKLGALLASEHEDILRIIAATDTGVNDWMDNAQIQALLDNNAKYDILLFVQIPREYFHPDVLAYLEVHAIFRGRGNDPEFFYRASHLEEHAIPHFNRYKDKDLVEQVRTLANDLKSVQYIHVIS